MKQLLDLGLVVELVEAEEAEESFLIDLLKQDLRLQQETKVKMELLHSLTLAPIIREI